MLKSGDKSPFRPHRGNSLNYITTSNIVTAHGMARKIRKGQKGAEVHLLEISEKLPSKMALGAVGTGLTRLLKHQRDVLLCFMTINVSQAASNALE